MSGSHSGTVPSDRPIPHGTSCIAGTRRLLLLTGGFGGSGSEVSGVIQVQGGTGIGLVLAAMLCPVLTLVILARYRAAVGRSMQARVGAAPAPAPALSRPNAPGSAWLQVYPAGRPPASGPLADLAHARVRRTVAWYVVAGLVFALVAALVENLLLVGWIEPWPITVSVFEYVWPLVLTVAFVAGLPTRQTLLLVAGYALAGLLLTGGSAIGARAVAIGWGTNALVPTLIILAVAARPLRAVGPFLAPSAVAAGGALAAGGVLAGWLADAGLGPIVALLLAATVIVLGSGLGLLAIPLAARRYRRKAASDQSLLVDQWWLLFSVVHTALALNRGPVPAAMLLPYLGYRVVIGVGRRRAGRDAARYRSVQLLLLRVFGDRGRSQWLMRDLGIHWRHIGSIEMIAGPDLVSENLEPHEFLDFLLGRLSRQFITTPDDLRHRLAAMDLRPDADGRFRVNEFCCHDDTWRPTLKALVGVADVILVDLRGLSRARQGVVYEIKQLAGFGLLGRVVALVDHTTDLPFLQETLDLAGAPGLRTVEVVGRRTAPRELLAHLEWAVPRPADRPPAAG
jgi:hypothetical protein